MRLHINMLGDIFSFQNTFASDNSLILTLSVDIAICNSWSFVVDTFYFLFVYIQNSKLIVWRKLSEGFLWKILPLEISVRI